MGNRDATESGSDRATVGRAFDGGTFDAVAEVDRLLALATAHRASDLHLEPERERYLARVRVDGVMRTVAELPADAGRAAVARLMVLARLLTYRVDVPQEGRAEHRGMTLRVSTMPTAKGLRGSVRLPADLSGEAVPRSLEALGLPPATLEGLRRFARSSSGLLIVTGPAGSGKTTLLYAMLAELAAHGSAHSSAHGAEGEDGGGDGGGEGGGEGGIVSLEDPVERELPGVTQIEVKPFGELTYERALRSMLRQDPRVLMLGEVRDGATARLAAQAALSGHRLLCTLHADDPAGAVRRMLDLGVEPGALASSLTAVVALRLVRRLAPAGAGGAGGAAGERYRGRTPVAEFVTFDDDLRRAVARDVNTMELRLKYTSRPSHVTLRQAAATLVEAGVTDLTEVQRVLGFEEQITPA